MYLIYQRLARKAVEVEDELHEGEDDQAKEGYGKYQAQTREEVWVVSLFFFIFLFFCKGMIVDKTNSDQGKGFDRYAGRV